MNVCRTVAMVCIATLPATVLAQPQAPVTGAWELVSTKNLDTGAVTEGSAAGPNAGAPFRVIYLDGYYVQFAAAAKRPTTATAEMSADQLRDRLRMQGQQGTYKIAGNKLMKHVVTAADPNNDGRDITDEFRVQGDQLIVIGMGGGPNRNNRVEQTFKRLRPTS
jgi:hypothetical protein